MKFKVVYRKKTGIKRFRIESDKNDELGYAEAETLKRGGLSSLVPLTYEQRGRIYRFTYAAQGFVPLSKMTGEPFAPRQLERMLTSFYALLLECENNGLMRQRVCADPEYILYNEAARECRFIYVPLQSFAPVENDLKGALIYMCDRAKVPPAEVALRERVLDYLRRTAVFTSVDFGAFLRSMGLVDAEDASFPEVARDSAWLDTDQLGDRANHGLDFVAVQQREAYEAAQAATYDVWTGQQANASSPQAPGVSAWKLIRMATGESWLLGEGAYDVGRVPECSIALPHVVGLSRRHAELCVYGGACSVRDLGSTNGVFVNGGRVPARTTVPLYSGAELTLGEENFVVQEVRGANA